MVRVSRRVGKNHFGKIAQGPSSRRAPGQHAFKPTHRLWHPATPSCLADAPKWPAVAGFPGHAPRIHFYRVRLNDFKSFDPLSRVLFIFPSQYLFAIGLLRLFSLRRSLSPALRTSIKVRDSSATGRRRSRTPQTGLSPSSAAASAALLRPGCGAGRLPSDYNSPR